MKENKKKRVTIVTEGLSFKNPNGILTWLNSILHNISAELFDFRVLNITTDIEDYPKEPPETLSYLINIDPWNLKERHYRFSNEEEVHFAKVNDNTFIKKIKKYFLSRVRDNSLVAEQIIKPAYDIVDYFELPTSDIIHAANPGLTGVLGVIMSKNVENKKLIISQHGDIVTEWKLRLVNPYFLGEIRYPKELKRKQDNIMKSEYELIHVLKYTLEHANLILPVANFHLRRDISLGISKSKIIVLRNGISTNTFSNRKEMDKCKEVRVGIVARVNPIKNLENIATSAKQIAERGGYWEFHIYGPIDDYDYYNYLRGILEDLKVDDLFTFHDATWNPSNAFNDIDIFALPSLMEGLPYSLIEATAVGLPSVATNVGGVKEIIGHTGYIAEPLNPMDFTRKLRLAANELLNHKKYRQKQAQRKKVVEESFLDKLFINTLQKIYGN